MNELKGLFSWKIFFADGTDTTIKTLTEDANKVKQIAEYEALSKGGVKNIKQLD